MFCWFGCQSTRSCSLQSSPLSPAKFLVGQDSKIRGLRQLGTLQGTKRNFAGSSFFCFNDPKNKTFFKTAFFFGISERLPSSYIKPKYPAVTLPGQMGSPEPTGQRWKNVRACEQCWCNKILAWNAKLSCHNFTLCWVMVFIDHTIVASINVWQPYFAIFILNTFNAVLRIHLCCNLHTFWVTQFWLKPCLCQTIVFFHVCRRPTTDCCGLASIVGAV